MGAPETSTYAGFQHLELPDGRRLEYTEGGARDGYPLLWIHGTPGAANQMGMLERVCSSKKVKLITFSRSGFGGSSRNKGRIIADDVHDIEALLEHIGIRECVVGGWSGGGPHSLACAARLKRCRAALVVAGVAPYGGKGLNWTEGMGEHNIVAFELALKGEEGIAAFCEAERPGLINSTPDNIIEQLESILPEADKRAIRENRELAEDMCTSMKEALRNGCEGWIDDDLAMVQPSWGFELDEISVPVYLWAGATDLMVPFNHARWLADNIPKDKLTKHFQDEDGHISIFLANLERMLDELLQHA